MASSLPESTSVVLLRRYSTDPELDEAAEKLTNCARTSKQYLAAAVVNMLGFLFGTALGWPAMAQPQLMSEPTPFGGPPVSSQTMSWLAAVLCIGCVLGTFLFGWLADRLGRRRAGLIGAVPFLASWLCILLADQLAALYVARVLAGLAGGSSLVVCPLYVGETAEDSLRGLLGSLFSILLTAGILFSYVVGSCTTFHTFAGICLALPCVFLACFFWLPDTPVFLLSQGRVPLAVRSLTWLRGGRADLVDDELARLVANMKEDTGEAGASGLVLLRQLVATRASQRALCIVMVLFTAQQFCGINAILSYTVEIFKESGSTLDPGAATIIVGALQLAGVCTASLVVDRLGRRVLLLASYCSMCCCLAILGGCFYLKAAGQDVASLGWLPLTCLSLYSVTYALGAGPVPFILVSELFPSSVRTLATSVSIALCSVLAFLVMKFYADMCLGIGEHGSMWVFSGCSLAGALFAWFGVPETKGKPLAVIQYELEGRRPQPPQPRTFNPAPGDIFYFQPQEEAV